CGTVLDASGSCELVLMMEAPDRLGRYTASLMLPYANERATLTLPVNVHVAEEVPVGTLKVLPGMVDFGDASPVAPADSVFQIINEVPDDIEVASLDILDQSADFQILESDCSRALSKDESCEVSVRFFGTNAGIAQAHVSIISDN